MDQISFEIHKGLKIKEKRIDKKQLGFFWNQNIHKVITYLDVPNLSTLSSAGHGL